MVNRFGLAIMPRKTKKQLRGQKAAEARWSVQPVDLEARRLAFSVLVEGCRPEQTLHLLRWLDMGPDSRRKFYNELFTVGEAITALARSSIEYERSQIPPGSIISFDGSWDHRRQGSRCLFTVICQQTGKIIESVTISNRADQTLETFCLHSNLMEAHGLRIAVDRLKDLPQIVGYVHDNDAKATKIIQDAGWQIQQFLDPGHALKCFERRLQKLNTTNPHLLRGIEASLTRWLKSLMHLNAPIEDKKKLWLNSVKHYMGDHRECLHEQRECRLWDKAADAEAVKAFKAFLESTEFIIEYCNCEYDIQSNESLHRLKLKYACKDVNWGDTWTARMMCAVLDRNMYNWKLYLYDQLGLPELSTESRRQLQLYENQRISRKLYVHSDAYKEKQHLERKQRRQRFKQIGRQMRQLIYGIERQ